MTTMMAERVEAVSTPPAFRGEGRVAVVAGSGKLPEETATLKPGPNREVAQNNCTGCHSADYIGTQPQSIKPRKDFWQTEVTKMIKAYGAPVDDADAKAIAEYLAKNYGS